jgi:D-alanyl-D-alanine carboxypeptidase/D-alanyl-D-alanine-endopeptidase (penicillin-binding protein 4)
MFVFPSVGTIYSYFTKQAQPYTNSLDLQAGKVKVSSNFASLSADDIEKIKQAVSSLPSNLPADSKVGVEVIDTKGSEVASLNKSEQLPPASTLKTLTALAASNSLDLSKTLDTKAVLSTDEGTLTLVGAGDMLLGAGQSDKNAINGRAGLASLANDAVTALKAKKISSVSLAYSNMFKNNEPVPPAYVSENYLSSGDYAPLSSYAINEGRVGTADLSPRVDNPALGVASSFADALRAGGIQVNDTSEQAYNENPAGSTLSYVSSAPLRDMLQYTLSNSDNTLAEEFGRFVGLSVSNSLDRKTSLMAVKSVITKLGINLNSSVIDDCSGLSATNRLTADVLAKVQKKMQNETFALLPARGLPISGYSGSLADSFHEDYIKDGIVGYVRAKTGTLARTASLSGVFMKDASKPIIFSVIINTASENTLGQAKEAIDIFVNSLL